MIAPTNSAPRRDGGDPDEMSDIYRCIAPWFFKSRSDATDFKKKIKNF